MSVFMTIVILAVGSVSGVAAAQFVLGSDGGNINGSIVACVYGACKDNTFNGGSSSGSGGGGGQPTPTTGKLTVIKEVDNTDCPQLATCNVASDFEIKVSGTNVSPSGQFPGSTTGTEVTLDPGQYTVSEVVNPSPNNYDVTFSGQCQQVDNTATATGNMNAGDSQTCTITNTFHQ